MMDAKRPTPAIPTLPYHTMPYHTMRAASFIPGRARTPQVNSADAVKSVHPNQNQNQNGGERQVFGGRVTGKSVLLRIGSSQEPLVGLDEKITDLS